MTKQSTPFDGEDANARIIMTGETHEDGNGYYAVLRVGPFKAESVAEITCLTLMATINESVEKAVGTGFGRAN